MRESGMRNMNPLRTARRKAGAVAALSLASMAIGLSACNPPSDQEGGGEVPDTEEDLVAQAQEEGLVVLGTGGHTEEQLEVLKEAFDEKYGIEVQWVREGSGDIVQKVEAQRTAENIAFDIVSLLDEGTMRRWSEEGFLDNVDIANIDDIIPALQVGDDAAYYPIYMSPLGCSYNTAINPNPPDTWEELANANGALGLGNPATSGTSLIFASV